MVRGRRINPTLINYSELAEVNVKLQNYDLVLIDFKMSLVDGFDLYEKLLETSKKAEETQSKDFRISVPHTKISLKQFYSIDRHIANRRNL